MPRVLSTSTSSLGWSLVWLSLFAALALIIEAVMLARLGIEPTWLVELFPAIAALYVAVGVVAWWRRPANPLGRLMVFGGLTMAVAGLVNIRVPAFVAAGTVVATLILAIVVHLLHAFPSGRVRGRLSRWTVAGAYFVTLIVRIPLYLFAQPDPNLQTILRVHEDLEIYNAARLVSRVGIWIVMAATAYVLIRRVLDAPGRQRPGLACVYLVGLIAVLALPFAPNVAPWLLGFDALQIVVMQLVFLAIIPPALAIAMLNGEFGRVGGVETLVKAAGPQSVDRATLEQAVAAALGDPSVRLWFGADHPPPGRNRGAARVRLGDEVAATIEYDAIQFPDATAVGSAASLVGVILERDRLAAELRRHEEELLRSRTQVVVAADAERRRIARDLHDGLQVKLVLLALHARSPEVRPDALADQIEASMDELRALIHGVMPPVLLERGLAAALADLADRSSVPVELDLAMGSEALDPATESAAYFVTAEALTNALKHAAPTRVLVRAERADGRLRLEIADDGSGVAEAGTGAGLMNLRQRVTALGGAVEFDTPAEGGTRVIAEVPCAS